MPEPASAPAHKQAGRAFFLAIEGLDGAGKGTQTKALVARAEAAGLSVASFAFPRYGQSFFSRLITDYLNGRYGPKEASHPLFPALLFAAERFEEATALRQLLAEHDLVVVDRYAASNMAYQTARLTPEAARALAEDIAEIEYSVFAIPRPDLTLLLDLSPAEAQDNVLKKAARDFVEGEMDQHERDGDFLGAVRQAYLRLADAAAESEDGALASLGPWQVIDCRAKESEGGDGGLRPVDEITAEAWAALSAQLERR